MATKEISVKKYVVRLSGEERERLEALLRKGKSPAQRMLKARILLKADVSEAGEGWSDSRIIKALDTSVSMVYRVRKQLAEEGFEAVLSRKQRATPAVARIFDGEKEAKLIALACSKPPKDAHAGPCGCWRKRSWNSTSSIAPATERSEGRSKKHSPTHRRQCWVIPPKANSAFVAAMEDVLAVYTRPRDADHPLCPGRDLKATARRNAPADPDEAGTPGPLRLRVPAQRHRQPLHVFAPLEGWRHVKVTDRHTAVDYAHVLKDLADVHSPTPGPLLWSRTISTSTARHHSTKHFRPPKPGGWSSALNGTTPQSMAVGLIWRSPNSASYRPSASIAGFPTNKPSSRKSPLGSTTAMPTTPRQTGTSNPEMLVSNSSTFTLQSD